jgi:hypothetical protein
LKSTEDLVGEGKVGSSWQRLDADLAVTELPVPAGLLLVPAVGLRCGGNGLEIRDAGQLQRHVHAEAALQLGHGHFEVQLPLAGNQLLVRSWIAVCPDRRVFFLQAMKGGADLLFIRTALRLECVRHERLGERDRGEHDVARLVRQRVAGLGLLEFRNRTEIARVKLLDTLLRLALHREQVADTLL